MSLITTLGDAYDSAIAESFVDTFKAELVADRSWRSRSQLELAVVEYVSWFNHYLGLYVRQGLSILSWN